MVTTHVRIVGAGLIGTSLGIALSHNGFRVSLDDPSPTAVRLARDLQAGEVADDETDAPDVVVVAAPPDVAARVVVAALDRWPDAVVTDVASVKESVLRVVLDSGADSSRYVGSHPMAGRERSGAAAARADLFDGRAWVVVPHEAVHRRSGASGPRARARRRARPSASCRRTSTTRPSRPSRTCRSSPRASSPRVCASCPSPPSGSRDRGCVT